MGQAVAHPSHSWLSSWAPGAYIDASFGATIARLLQFLLPFLHCYEFMLGVLITTFLSSFLRTTKNEWHGPFMTEFLLVGSVGTDFFFFSFSRMGQNLPSSTSLLFWDQNGLVVELLLGL